MKNVNQGLKWPIPENMWPLFDELWPNEPEKGAIGGENELRWETPFFDTLMFQVW
ncbi:MULTISPECIES: hypothetical protein [unclassified Methanoregula]|uniref:hypothetical protein n=1 Tax=unclassified Methanoregula TaxID=2649730 RepID=UPI0009C5DE4C|nr:MULTISPECIES: hypothetical protein [unclassified Methanoregula]OPX64237.1 MAG: hypothetical protein A4E33_01266 [Methanoregula sp. PtaB.Bin085]OPY33639.1 MAG: hypothetical protein A4E34_01962 [Methanoregula sp. PtaU1.Bin006]